MDQHPLPDPEKAPLLAPPSIGVPVATKEPRSFKGRWWHVLGDFGAADVSATCLAWNAPWVAYGWNAQRGLGLSWWKEALKLMALTCGVFALVRVVLCLLVETQCPDVPHGPHGRMHYHHHHWGHGMHPYHHAGDAGPRAVGPLPIPADATQPFDPAAKAAAASAAAAAATVDVSTQTAAAAQDPTKPEHGPHRPDRHDDDHDDDHHEHHGPHHPDHHHHHRKDSWADFFHGSHADQPAADATKASSAAATTTATATTSSDDDDDVIDGDAMPAFNGQDDDDEDDDDDDFDFDDLTPEQREALKRCAVRVGPWAVVLFSVALSAALYATYLAALRRRMMRERFGIEGSFKHDLLLWGCCAPCALAQETRTLMFNNVEEGLWHGPLQATLAASAAPRQVQPMAA